MRRFTGAGEPLNAVACPLAAEVDQFIRDMCLCLNAFKHEACFLIEKGLVVQLQVSTQLVLIEHHNTLKAMDQFTSASRAVEPAQQSPRARSRSVTLT